MNTPDQPLRALVIDDEQPALDELRYLLDRDPRIGELHTCSSATDALKLLQQREVDVVFLDIQMPGLTGLELAQVFSRFAHPPAAVFVSAHEQHGVEAFDLNAVDYVLKPVRAERLAEAVRRVVDVRRPATATEAPDEQIPVERGGVTRFVPRSQIRWVEAEGDYVRLHTEADNHLIRVPLGTLEQEWAAAGFLRIHRSTLVNLAHVTALRTDQGRAVVMVEDTELPVSRRLAPALRAAIRNRKPGPS